MDTKKTLSDVLDKKFKFNVEKPFSTFPSILNSIAILIFFTICFYAMYVYSSYDRLKLIWPKKKCSPDMTFMAGIFKPKDDPRSAFQYTFDVFSECNKNILYSVVMFFVRPFYKIFDILNKLYAIILDLGITLRNIARKVTNTIRDILEDIAAKAKAIVVPFLKIFPILQDTVNKGTAFLTIAVNSIRGILLTAESALATLYIGTVDLMIILAVTGIGWILGPFTIPLYIILAIVLEGIKKIFDLKYLAPIPKIKFCFDENTIIQTKDGPIKIKDISVGTILYDGSKVTSKFVLNSISQTMYKLNNVVVSGSHKIFFRKKWIEISKHPNALKIKKYNKPKIYCLNTNTKRIVIDTMIFSDWDDIDNSDIKELNEKYSDVVNNVITESNIQKYFESGFVKNTQIEIEDGRSVNIQDLEINDVLINGDIVKGLVEIDATNVDIYEYFIETNKVFGGPNLQIYNHSTSILDSFELCKMKTLNKEDKLYHVITDSLMIKINDIKFLDYNGAIETLLLEDRLQLLKSI